MIMKKMFYLLTVLMIGISCALTTGCSDDDDNNNPPPVNPGDTIVPGDTVTPPLPPAKDTVWQVKSVKIDDIETPGFYKMIKMETDDKQLTGVNVSKYSPDGLNGEPLAAKVAYEEGKMTFSYEEAGTQKQIVYTLNAKGFATRAKSFELYEGEAPYLVAESGFAYHANGMLERIFVLIEEEEADLFRATFQADTNWATCLADPESGNMATCVFSANKNNYTVDLNMLALVYGFQADVDFAVLCGLLPSTPDVLASLALATGGEEMKKLTKSGNMVINFKTTLIDKRVSVLEMTLDVNPMKKFTFAY